MNPKAETSLFTNWHLMRWVALAAGLFLMVQALRYADWLSGALGAFFLFQAYTNTGCLVGTCGTAPMRTNDEPQSEINEPEYTEIR